MEEKVLDILCEVCGSDEPKENLDVQLFEEGLLDSFGSIQLLVAIEALGVSVAISDFEREQWATPKMIIENVKKLS